MPIVIKCPHCKEAIQLPDGSGGKQFKCPKPNCQKAFTVPASVGGSSASINLGNGSKPGAPAKPGAAPTKCPACSSDLLPGAIACMDCGFLLQSDSGGGGGDDG